MYDEDEDTELIQHPDGYYIRKPKSQPFTITQTSRQQNYIEPDRKIKKTRKAMDTIIQALSRGKSITAACNLVGITPSTLRYWRKNDEKFHIACSDAFDVETDNQETELNERITRGTRTEHYGPDGELKETRYAQNDTLLLRSLERRRPEAWNRNTNNRVEITGRNGGPLTSVNIDFNLSVVELAKLGHVPLACEYMNMLDNERKLLEDKSK